MTTLHPIFIPEPVTHREHTVFDEISRFYLGVKSILNRGIRFEDNVDCRVVTFTSDATADTETAVPHTLGKIPTGYIIIAQDAAGILYTSTGGTAWTATNVYLKCTVASVTFKVIII